MPVQQQMSSFAKKLGGRVAAANAEHKDKPVDTGNRRLPAGIKAGVAKLSAMYTKEYDTGKSPGGPKPPGVPEDTFFRASAIVDSPVEHKGEKVRGLVTSVMIPLCDVPAGKGENARKAVSFSDNWYKFQNVFKLLGIAPCPETQVSDPTGQKTEGYFFAAMKTLTDPVRMKTNPIYVSFNTEGWTPPATQQRPKPDEYIKEIWIGLAQAPATNNPAAGVTVTDRPPAPPHGPPTGNEDGLPVNGSTEGVKYDSIGGTSPASGEQSHLSDEVSGLVEAAMGDPNGETADGQEAGIRLQELAWASGWTKQQTADAQDWAQVGEMALSSPKSSGATAAPDSALTPSANGTPAVGNKYKFAKRTQDGARLTNAKGEAFPPQEVEVTVVDAVLGICVVKSCKDGKVINDIRTKAPVAVKFEWLE